MCRSEAKRERIRCTNKLQWPVTEVKPVRICLSLFFIIEKFHSYVTRHLEPVPCPFFLRELQKLRELRSSYLVTLYRTVKRDECLHSLWRQACFARYPDCARLEAISTPVAIPLRSTRRTRTNDISSGRITDLMYERTWTGLGSSYRPTLTFNFTQPDRTVTRITRVCTVRNTRDETRIRDMILILISD